MALPATLAEVKAAKLTELRRLQAEAERRERERLAAIDVFALLGYEPNCLPRYEARKLVAARLGIADPFDAQVTEAGAAELPPPCGKCPQEQFHAATEWDVLFGGSSGGGKTRAICCEAIRACVRHPGLRVGAFRRSYPELKESLIAELANMEFCASLNAQWNGSEYTLRFPNSSQIMFRYAETIKDATRRQGSQYQLIVYDERTTLAPDVTAFLESRLRSGRSDVPVLGVRSSANPGGVSHTAVKKRFIEPTNYGANTYIDSRGRSVRFVPSRLRDNPHVNPEYAADLRALPDKMRRAFLDGDWSAFEGQMYPELSEERHRIAPFAIPESWRKYVGIDYGWSAPWAVGWFALSPDGRVYVYREIYETQVGVKEQARRILAAEEPGEYIDLRLADSSMWASRGGDVTSIADSYAEEGCYLTPSAKGPGSRVSGWARLRSYLADGPACEYHRALGQAMCPMLHVFKTCPKWFEEISALPFAQRGNPEDSDPAAPDHMGDLTRYVLLNLGAGPKFLMPDEPVSSLADQIEVLEPHGNFAVRRRDNEPDWGSDDDEPRAQTRRSPFV